MPIAFALGMRRAHILVVLFLTGLAGGLAHANVPRHEKAKALKKGKTGFKLQLVLTTTDAQRFPKAYVGLVDPSVTRSLTREDALHTSRGKLLHQFAPVTVGAQPKQVELEYTYGKGGALKSGMRVHVVTAWPVAGQESSIHVFGAVLGTQGPSDEVPLP